MENRFMSPDAIVLEMGGDQDWEYGITETTRIDRTVLAILPESMLVQLNQWERKLKLNYTRHAKCRLEHYINKWSDRPWTDGNQKNHDLVNLGHYIEVYPSEYQFLSQPYKLEPYLPYAKRVEMGFNELGQICKVSYVLNLSVHCPQLYTELTDKPCTSRWLFICVGVDGFIKTINITPGEKHRKYYGGKIEYLSFEELLKHIY